MSRHASTKTIHDTLKMWAAVLVAVAFLLLIVCALFIIGGVFGACMPEEKTARLLLGFVAGGFGLLLFCGSMVMDGVAQIVLNTAPSSDDLPVTPR